MPFLSFQLEAIRSKVIPLKKHQLESENEQLRAKVELARQQLIALETQNGKKQIPLPGTPAKPSVPLTDVQQNVPVKPKEKKEKKPKEKKEPAAQTSEEEIVDISRIDLRIGKIVDVQKHPDADSLYVEKIDVGEPAPRTVISGLVKHVPIEEMQNRLVCVMCNLKPVKMRGILSEGMVMCASTPEKVEVLIPPSNAVPGDLVHCEGYNRKPDAQLNPKKKIFETVAPDLATNDQFVACYKGSPLVVSGKGPIKSILLKNVNVK